MSRIPDAFIQDLLARSDIVDIIGSRIELKRAGREYHALCPFHNEKSPSFTVSPNKQFFHCFGCGKHGTVVAFLMEYDRLPFVEAIEELARIAGVEVPREGDTGPSRAVLEGPLDALAGAERFFREQLRKSPPAIDYLKGRGVTGETAKLFGIGFALDAWDALAKFFDAPTHALAAGLLKQSGDRVYDVFRNRIMFPIRDTRGRVIAFGGRTLANDPAKYLNSPETALFHKGRNLFGLFEARQSMKSTLPYLLVVEGYMDAVMLAQHGFRNVVATLGTATTRDHLNLMFKSTSRVVFCFDGDRAGRAAAWRALDQALPELAEGREFRFMFLPDGKDPDELVQEIGQEAFGVHVEQATSLADYLLDELKKQANPATLEGRAKFVTLAKPFLSKMREGPLRELITDEVAKLARLSRADFTIPAPKTASGREPAAPTSQATFTLAKPVRDALRCLLEQPGLAAGLADLELVEDAGAAGLELLLGVTRFLAEHGRVSAAQLVELWRDRPEAPILSRLAAEVIEPGQGEPGQMLAEAWAHLRTQGQRTRAGRLLKTSEQRSLSAPETAELQRLTQQLARR
jgi:DNA primase